METVGIEPTPCSVQARGTPQSASPGETERQGALLDLDGAMR